MKSVILFLTALVFSMGLCADSSPTIYQTDEIIVTLDDFESYLVARDITDDHRKQALSKPGAVRQIVDTIFLIKAVGARAAVNPKVDRAQIEASVADHRMRLLMRAQMDLDIEAELAQTDWDALAMDEYKASPDRFKRPATVRAAHILVYSSDRTAEELEERVREVTSALEHGDDFGEVAKIFSDDSVSAAKGGDLGFFARGRMVPEFEQAAFALENVGDVSEPITSQFGVHIIKLLGRKAEGMVPFEEAKPQIMTGLERAQASRAREAVLERVKKESTRGGLGVNDELLLKLEEMYAQPPRSPDID